MQIDWFTFGAQVVNFLILLKLLWHFLYKPVTRAMDQREDAIRERIEAAKRDRDDAQALRRDLEQERARIDDERKQVLEQAREDAGQQRRQLLHEARERVAQAESDWRSALTRQQAELVTELRRRTAKALTDSLGKALTDLAGRELQGRMVDAFLERLGNLGDEEASILSGAAEDADQAVAIISAFELTDEQRERLTEQISARLDRATELTYETSEALICGIELRLGDRSLGWSVDRYLAGLADRIEDALQSTAARQAATDDANDEQAKDQSDEQSTDPTNAREIDKPDAERAETGNTPSDSSEQGAEPDHSDPPKSNEPSEASK